MGITLIGTYASFPLLSSASPFLTFSSVDGIGGSMVCLPPGVVIAIQCTLFFEFWTVLLGRVPGCRVFTIAHNWATCNSICLIKIACVSTFYPILAKSHLNSLMCSSLVSNLLIILCNISSTCAILSPPSLGVTSRF